MASTTTNNNQVVFFLDGEEYFTAVLAGINAVINAGPGTPQTYVRMAYWSAIHDMPLANGLAGLVAGVAGPITIGDLLETKLREVAMAGFPVDVILLKPSRANRAVPMMDNIYNAHVEFEKTLGGWKTGPKGAGNPGNGLVRVFLEEFRAWNLGGFGASNHQKFVICSVNGQRTVFLGGLNLARGYWDNTTHTRNANPWHDTGVSIAGPATNAVEAEWTRRWNKSGEPLVANPTVQNTFVGGAAPANGANAVAVTIATTMTEGGNELDVQAELVNRIAAAANYIYLENYAFTDPGLTAALVARLPQGAAAPPPPTIIVNVAHQGTPYDWLDYVAWSQLAFLSCTSVTVPNPAGAGNVAVVRAVAPTWAVQPGSTAWSAGNWLQNTNIQWQQPGPYPLAPLPPIRLTNISQIVGFVGGIQFYRPIRYFPVGGPAVSNIYLHSKLALFDDQWLVVGTANLTSRSMLYDGEMMAFCNSVPLATAARTRLFQHYNTDAGGPGQPAAQAFAAAPNAANWDAVAVENEVRRAGVTLTAGHKYIIPVTVGHFLVRVPPNNAQSYVTNYTWY